MKITGHKCPYAIGISRSLRSRTDQALDEPARFQGGIDLILSILRKSTPKVVIHTGGSCRDVAAAFNREPALFKDKVRAVYLNIGRGPNEPQDECNVAYDAKSFLRMFETGLPIYWCPCFGKNGFETHYDFNQPAVLGACTQPVQNYFVYCLTLSKEEPMAFLRSGPHVLPTGPRNMWCTAPLLHAAGRKVYQRGPNDFIALTPPEAEARGLSSKVVRVFDFVPMQARLEEGGAASKGTLPRLTVALDSLEPNGLVFRSTDPRYKQIMASCIKNLLAELGRN